MDDRAMDNRIVELNRWLRHYNMVPRADSELCRLFAENRLSARADVVARELMATHFLYSQTLYGELSETYHRALANAVRKKYRLNWTSTWILVKFYGRVSLKLLMLLRCGVAIPPQLPPPQLPPP